MFLTTDTRSSEAAIGREAAAGAVVAIVKRKQT